MVLLRKNLSFLNKSQKRPSREGLRSMPIFLFEVKNHGRFYKKIYFPVKDYMLFCQRKRIVLP